MKWLGYGIATLLVLCMLASGMHVLLSFSAKSSLKVAVEQAREKGLPMEPADLVAEVADTHPAAPVESSPGSSAIGQLYGPDSPAVQLYEFLVSDRDWSAVFRGLCQVFPDFTEEQEQEVRRILDEWKELIARVKAIAPLPLSSLKDVVAVVDLDGLITRGSGSDIGHWNALCELSTDNTQVHPTEIDRSVWNLLLLDAYIEWRDGHDDEALRTCGTLLKLVNHKRTVPVLGIQGSCQSFITWRLPGFLSRFFSDGDFSPDAVESFNRIAAAAVMRDAYPDALRASLVGVRHMFKRLNAKDIISSSSRGLRHRIERGLWKTYRLPYLQFFRDRDEASAITLMGRLVDLSRLPYYEGRDVFERENEHMRSYGISTPVAAKLTWSAAFIPGRINGGQARLEAALDQARIALALNRYWKTTGEYPDALERLVPEYLDVVPIDQFTGQPMGYERLDELYLLYSAGENGVRDIAILPEEADVDEKTPTVFGMPVRNVDDFVWGFVRPR